ncbi:MULTISPECIES: hypothetical protein [Streptomyces]|uniref:Uncharacterized protein n=2 Tax=Streptomyces TaxID=1883 RepID=A0ABV9BW73_9ACTN
MFIPHAAPCSEVMKFAGGRMPQQSTDKKCVNEGAWLGRTYSAEFTMPRDNVVARLEEAFPGTGTGDCGPICLVRYEEERRSTGQASVLELDVRYEGQDTARVKLQAYNT